MATMEEKEIAKDILIKLLDESGISTNEFADSKPVEMTCKAYQMILNAVSKD